MPQSAAKSSPAKTSRKKKLLDKQKKGKAYPELVEGRRCASMGM
jgi:translation elongation factor EF-4